jgi:hypothetical protein
LLHLWSFSREKSYVDAIVYFKKIEAVLHRKTEWSLVDDKKR